MNFRFGRHTLFAEMTARSSVLALVALLTVTGGAAQGPQKYYCASRCSRKNLPCPSPCRPCSRIPPCPAPFCPHPECTAITRLNACSEPVCAPLPKIPACPTPKVHLSCPQVACPHHSCPACPRCPDIRPCPVCPTTAPATTTAARTTTATPRTTARTTVVPWFTRALTISTWSTPRTVVNTSTTVADALVSGLIWTNTTPSGTPVPLPYGYERASGIGAFKFFGIKRSWPDANATCSQDGAYLAIPKNRSEMDLLVGIMRTYNTDLIHVGFHNPSGMSFITALGGSMTSGHNSLWASTEPSGGSMYGCTYLSRRGLVSEKCSDREIYICEIPIK